VPAEKDIAIVLRLVEFSETSLIVTLLTRQLGKIHALAKGARRLKGPFESALDLLAVCRIVFLRKSSDALDLLTEAKLQRSFRVPRGDLSSLYAAYYVAELLDGLTDDYDPHPELFDLADQTLMGLSQGDHVARRVLRFELGAMGLVGHLPSLEMCVECGQPAQPVAGRVAFGQLDGGVLCTACRAGKRQVALVGPAALRTMARLADPDSQAWQRMEIDPRTYGEVRGVLNHYVSNVLGRKPRLHEYLGAIGM
jgi:DNA repair protein RecO (recombination protein O)